MVGDFVLQPQRARLQGLRQLLRPRLPMQQPTEETERRGISENGAASTITAGSPSACICPRSRSGWPRMFQMIDDIGRAATSRSRLMRIAPPITGRLLTAGGNNASAAPRMRKRRADHQIGRQRCHEDRRRIMGDIDAADVVGHLDMSPRHVDDLARRRRRAQHQRADERED